MLVRAAARGMRGLWIMVAFAGLPFAAAQPTSAGWDESTWEEVYRGVATPGSADDFWDWWGDEISCTQSFIEIWMELRILGGSGDDALLLEVPLSGIAAGQPRASHAAPALMYAEQSDGCPDFIIHGAEVATATPYELRITYHGICVPTPCANGPANTLGRLI